MPLRAVMDIMGWSEASMAQRYMHVPHEMVTAVADQVGGLMWPDEDTDSGESGEAGSLDAS